jgi:hypothetical protein
MITYGDRVTPVQLGDCVRTRIWFRRHEGRVAYVPGVSPFNPAMEYNGLRWVGVRLAEGGFVSVVVDPDHEFLHGKLAFVARDAQSVAELAPDQDPHGDDSFGAPF